MSDTKDGTFIHKTAVIEKGAKLGCNVKIGPFCFVDKDVIIGDNVEIKAHVIIVNKVTIGTGTVVYPFAVIGEVPQNVKYHGMGAEVIIGRNNIIREHVTINLGTEIDKMKTVLGDNCFIMTGSHIAHDCIVGNNVIMANNATLGGHVYIEDSVFIGGLSAIHQFVKIGKYVMIGGMSGVERDVVPFTTIIGNRAEIVGLNVIGLKRNGLNDADIHMIKRSYKILFDTSPGRNIDIGIKELEQKLANDKNVKHILNFLRSRSTRGIYRPKVFDNEKNHRG